MRSDRKVVFAKGNEVINVTIDETLIDVGASVTKHLVIVAQDEAKVTIDAKIVVEKSAQNARAFLKIEVLIVGGSPRVTILPHMEVKNSTAEARHSVSTVRLNGEALFYAKARGLNQTMVKELLLNNLCQ